MRKFYITNAIPYVNANPHIGHALEFIQSDVIARYHRLLNEEVLYLCGSDENALKNVQSAEAAGTAVQEFVDKYSLAFSDMANKLEISFDIFQRTSAENHAVASQKLWELCAKSEDIYKKKYKGLYCVGCEMFYAPEELNENGECFEHPGKKLEEVEEENYFFRLSKYQKQLIDLISSDTYKIVPIFRKNEMLSFLKNDLQDFSISRSNLRAKNWGVPVPNDNSQRIYVWFDALNVYQSGIGFGKDEILYQKWWPADLHVIGKGIIRFHAIYWPAILLSAGLKLPKKLFVHEYFTVNGAKMSKSLGNVIDPIMLIQKYGAEALRYYCLSKFSPFSDGDFSEKKFAEVYNADLANGLGNLVSRVAKLCEKNNFVFKVTAPVSFDHDLQGYLEEYRFNEALMLIWELISDTDKIINEKKPWKMQGVELNSVLELLVKRINLISYNLQPFMPETAQKIAEQFGPGAITAKSPLFPRLNI